MTRPDIDTIEARAKAATEGEWQSRESKTGLFSGVTTKGKSWLACFDSGIDRSRWVSREESKANADFVATMNPQATLDLIAYIRHLEST